ncbi:hypothetical protein [Amycolatopsis sp. NPDC051102]|uniref:hypothetical protein n=1 Tax=Amycolatopsis sp. NPDC051102 TaxID=3155163 RepID=UPI003440E1F6
MHKLARTLSQKTGVEVTATYDDFGSGLGWHLEWIDGPAADTMRKVARSAVRAGSVVDVAGLRYRRDRTDLAVVAAFLSKVVAEPVLLINPPFEVLHAYDRTDFPGSIPPEVWELARFAIVHAGVADYSADPARDVIDHVIRTGLNGLRLDLALDTRQPGEQSKLPALDVAGVLESLEKRVTHALSLAVDELVSGSAHRDDPIVRLHGIEAVRNELTKMADRLQRTAAVPALVDGFSLSSMSRTIGLSPRALGMRFGPELGGVVAPLAWLRDHVTEWAAACAAAAAAVRAGTSFEVPCPHELWLLDQGGAGEGWRSLVGTPEAARRLLAETRKSSPRGSEGALAELARLLEDHDRAEPPGRREGRARQPITNAPTRMESAE